jgi:ABC-2 type transport system permease protein
MGLGIDKPSSKMTGNQKDLLIELIKTDFKMKYQGSTLGFIWVLLKPFLIFIILYSVFNFAFGKQDPQYGLNLLLGILIFSFFSESTARGISVLLDNANIILKINFPREIVVFARILSSLTNLGIALLIFFMFWLFNVHHFAWVHLLFLPYILLLTLFLLGFGWFASIIQIRFRDLQSIWEVLLNLLFYGTPIFWPITILPAQYHKLLFLKPLAIIIQNSRTILIKNSLPDLNQTIYLTVLSVSIFIAGYIFFRKRVNKIAEFF